MEPLALIVLFAFVIVTRPVPKLLTVPVTVQLVSTTVIGVLVLYVKLPVMVTPVRLVGNAWDTLQVTAPLNEPVSVKVPLVANVEPLGIVSEPETVTLAEAVKFLPSTDVIIGASRLDASYHFNQSYPSLIVRVPLIVRVLVA